MTNAIHYRIRIDTEFGVYLSNERYAKKEEAATVASALKQKFPPGYCWAVVIVASTTGKPRS